LAKAAHRFLFSAGLSAINLRCRVSLECYNINLIFIRENAYATPGRRQSPGLLSHDRKK
jgi:hypothetical protein